MAKKIDNTKIYGYIVLIAVGIACLLFGIFSNAEAKKIKAYPTVQADIVSYKEVTGTDDDGDEYLDYYELTVEYDFEGTTYTKTRFRSETRKGPLTLYCNPNDPTIVRSEDYFKGDVYWFIYGPAIMLAGVGIMIDTIKKAKKSKDSKAKA